MYGASTIADSASGAFFPHPPSASIPMPSVTPTSSPDLANRFCIILRTSMVRLRSAAGGVVDPSGAERRALQLLGQFERPRGGAARGLLRFRRGRVAEEEP